MGKSPDTPPSSAPGNYRTNTNNGSRKNFSHIIAGTDIEDYHIETVFACDMKRRSIPPLFNRSDDGHRSGRTNLAREMGVLSKIFTMTGTGGHVAPNSTRRRGLRHSSSHQRVVANDSASAHTT
jgi:hypothetical protein